jgi:hypothetical protein
MPARLISPAAAFQASMNIAQRADSHGRATITKAEAEKALKQLQSPSTSPADQARVVQDFLDGKAAKSLSPKAREVLVDFVKRATDIPVDAGNKLDVQTAAREEATQASRNLEKAQDRLEKLIASGAKSDVRSGLQQVRAWLDAAEADILQAKEQLKKMGTHPAAKLANKELGTAQKEVAKAAVDVEKLVNRAKAGGVKKADLEAVRKWLAEPMPELESAKGALALGPPPPSGGGGVMHTMKAPSDHEDGGAIPAPGGGGIAVTEKYPSDNEDGGGHTLPPNHGGGGVMTTMKYPSDNEDGGAQPVDLGGSTGAVKKQRLDRMKDALERALSSGALDWKRGGVAQTHLGARFVTVQLKKEPGFDTYTYTAYIPVGALTPTAPKKDPNTVNEFYVERTGGLAGMTMSAGPLRIG